jgi:hypothetical protein
VVAAKVYRSLCRVLCLEGMARDDSLVDDSSFAYIMGLDGKFVTTFPHSAALERMAEVLPNI